MDTIFSDLAVAMGMGNIPILNGENKRLQDALINRQIECERIKVRLFILGWYHSLFRWLYTSQIFALFS